MGDGLGCSGPASFFGILRFPRITSDSGEHTSELNHSRARLICSGILQNPESGRNLEGRTLESTAYCAMCNKHTADRIKITKKSGVNDSILLLPAPRRKPLRLATVLLCCRHCCHFLSRGSTAKELV
jgi:hypothetical protein